MKKFVCLALLCVLASVAEAQLFRKTEGVDLNVQRSNAQKVVGRYRPIEKNIEFMMEHYTDGELRNYVKALNQAQIDSAKANGEPLPEKLSEDTLKSRKKIEEFLRAYFNISD